MATIRLRPLQEYAKAKRETLTAPVDLCLYRSTSCLATIRFLERVYNLPVLQGHPIHVDLQHVTRMTAAASLVLFANITAAQILTGYSPIISVTPPVDRQVRIPFGASGLHAALRPGGESKLNSLWEKDGLFLSGFDADSDYNRTVARLEKARGGTTLPDAVARAISEAILNVTHHAYELYDPKQLAKQLEPRWWHHYSLSDSGITFVIYDRGMGIPRTMGLDNPYNSRPENDAIGEAMRPGGTRYDPGSGRGNGSEDIKRPVKQGLAALLIMSGGARFELRQQSDPRTSLIGTNLSGTLVEWHQKFDQSVSDFEPVI